MNRSSQSKVNGGLVGVVMGVSAIAIALSVSGKGIERAQSLGSKSATILAANEIIDGCSLGDDGQVIVKTWNRALVASAHKVIVNPETCTLIQQHISMAQELSAAEGMKLQASLKEEIDSLAIDM